MRKIGSERLAEYRPGYSLPRSFYHDEDIFEIELDRIWRANWLFAGHSLEIPHPGDYFLFQVGADSIIIARGDGARLSAVHNVCRHRGSILLTQPNGHANRLVCPYHQWTYAPDGRLMTCRGMPEELDKSEWGLHRVAVREIEGLIFICLSSEPPAFEAANDLIAPMMRPQGFDGAQIAHVENYLVRANWKIIWENNRECYHCDVNHPEYIKANFDRYDASNLNPAMQKRIEAVNQESGERWERIGLHLTELNGGLFHFPDAAGKIWYSANRTALAEGFLTESLDGQPVGPRMGDYSDANVGTLRLRTLPNFWCHASSDHAVTTRLTPLSRDTTQIYVTWLVNAGSIAGKDYDLDRLLPFWKRTSEQDWEICERVQLGVRSTAYSPGPLSSLREYNLIGFLRWYTELLR